MKSIRFLFMFFVFVIVVAIYYNQSYKALIDSKTKQIEQTLVNHKALRKIINKHYIPEIKRLKEEGLLDKDYINPYFTSGTLLTQTLHEYTTPIVLEDGEEVSKYKLASPNPLNIKNKSTDYEEKIFHNLNDSKQEKYSEIIEENDNLYLFYAKPFTKMKGRCISCHSTPEAAPINQIKKYGSTSGYNYKVGDPSGLITMRSPLDKDILNMQNEVIYTSVIILFIFVFLYVSSEFAIYQLRKQRRKIARNKLVHNKLIKESRLDPLTGLLNRRSFEEIFRKERNRANRDNKFLVFLFIDIDYFKKYNDRYGHLKGDRVLKTVSKTLKKCFNRSHEHIFRLGGEEFAVISSEHSSDTKVLGWSDNLNNELAKLNIEHKDSPHKHLSVSIGIYIIEPGNMDISMQDIMKKSDEALYKAKSSGRNKAVIYSQ
ncbi:diguanylate cyclase [Sulfurimonas sp.]|nr:diguanylate cyclase [Sulfurimonas sp.]